MTVKSEAEALIAQIGADVEDYSEPGELILNLWTPVGMVWEATGGHSLTVAYYSNRPAGWAALLADLRQGVAPCDDPKCETCHP